VYSGYESEVRDGHDQVLGTKRDVGVLAEAKKTSVRNWAICLVAFRYGLRASELSTLRLSDVEGGFVDVQRLKGSERTRQAITSDPNPLLDVKAALAAWMREREDTGSIFLFTSRLGSGMTRRAMYNVFEDAAFRAGIDAGRRNIHICKHSLAVNLRKRGVPVDVVQKALGHARPETTIKFYYHTSQDEATAAISKAFAAA
jgi:integrase